MSEPTDYVMMSVRVPVNLREELRASAKAGSHSMNVEMLRRLRQPPNVSPDVEISGPDRGDWTIEHLTEEVEVRRAMLLDVEIRRVQAADSGRGVELMALDSIRLDREMLLIALEKRLRRMKLAGG